MSSGSIQEQEIRKAVYAWYDELLAIRKLRRERKMLDAKIKNKYYDIGTMREFAKRIGVERAYVDKLICKARRAR